MHFYSIMKKFYSLLMFSNRRQENRSFSISLLLVGCITFITFIFGCANIAAPSGGVRDSLPPVLVGAVPKDSFEHFTDKKIVFTFNEYVELNELQQNLLVSPTPKIIPQVESKLRTVTVRIKDTLEENTTYSINFGNAIRDINEGNVLKDFTYIFSTGDHIDNYELSGNVMLAETGKVDSTLIVMLHRKLDDSAVTKENPRYVAKLDGKGNFRFKFLPAGTFALYALKSEGGSRSFMSVKQLFAFADKPVTIGPENAPQTLLAYLERDTAKPKPTTSRLPGGLKEKEKAKELEKPLRYQTNLENGNQDLLGDFKFEFTTPLKVFDTTKISFVNDQFKPFSGAAFIMDSTNKIITLKHKWVPATSYKIIVQKDAFLDTTGKTVQKPDTISFKTKKNEDYGSLRMRFRNLNFSTHPVLQFIQSDKVVFSYVFQNRPDFYYKLFEPGDYDLRLLLDTNQNGQWDTGEFYGKHIQPEKVIAIPKKVKVKTNWDNEVEIEL